MNPSIEQLEKLQNLTKSYSEFSRKSSGVAYFFASALMISGFFIGQHLPRNVFGAIIGGVIAVVLIGLWLSLRQALMAKLYQQFGVARAAAPVFGRDFVLGILFGLGLSSLIFWLLSTIALFQFPQTYLYAVPAILVAAVLGFWVLKQSGDLLGMVVFILGGMIGGGINSTAENISELQRTLQLVLLVLIPISVATLGFLEHQKFKKLEQELSQLHQGNS